MTTQRSAFGCIVDGLPPSHSIEVPDEVRRRGFDETAAHEEFIVVEPSHLEDPDGSKLDGVLEAQLAIEQARSRRDAWMHLLALASIPVWIVATWPDALTQGLRSLLLAAWAACFAIVVLIIASEWRTRRRQTALLQALRSKTNPRAS